jgi:hypothetical protein
MAQRYQREIEEILEKVNEDHPPEGSTKRTASRKKEPLPRKPRRDSPLFGSFNFSPTRLLVGGVVLLFLALVLNGTALAAPAAWLGIGLLVGAYIMFFTKPRRPVERRWRGQSIDDEPEEGPFQRLWRWLTRG